MDQLTPITIDGLDIFDCVFHPPANRYYKRDGVEWIPLTREDIRAHLRSEGLSPRAGSADLSPVDAALVQIQNLRRVHYALPLAGYKAGLLNAAAEDGTPRRILVTSHTRPPEAKDTPWPNIQLFLKDLLGPAFPHVMGWCKWSRMNLKAGTRTRLPGQILVLVGPAGCGKSFLQKLITRMLGGRSANPWLYMSGQTPFNRDLFEAGHLVVEDTFHDLNPTKRRALGAKIKEFTVNDSLSCHGKGSDAIRLVPKWRISISLNDEQENMSQLPVMDESLKDKVMLIQCKMPRFPTDLSTEDGWKRWDQIINDEFPGFLHAVDEYDLAPLSTPRFGVRPWHDPKLIAQEDETAPEAVLHQLIAKDVAPMFPGKPEWQGTALELQSVLTDRSLCESATVASKLFYWAGACGTYLGRLKKRHPKTVDRRVVKGTTYWTLNLGEFRT